MKTVKIPDALHQKLKIASAQWGASVVQLTAEAIEIYLLNGKPKPKRAAR